MVEIKTTNYTLKSWGKDFVVLYFNKNHVHVDHDNEIFQDALSLLLSVEVLNLSEGRTKKWFEKFSN